MNAHEGAELHFPSRRDFLTLGIGAFAVAALPLARLTRPARVRRTLPVMGTLAEVVVVHRDVAYAQRAIGAAFAELQRVERKMTRFDPRSEVGRVNLGAAVSPVIVSDETARVVGEALRWAEVSGGRFDPSLGRLTELWDLGDRTVPPPAAEVRRFAALGLYRRVAVEWGEGSATIAFHAPEAGLDLGGIAKGYAVDRAAAAIRAWGIEKALVNVGGDIYAVGSSEDGDPWEIGIRSPHDPHGLVGTLRLADGAVATSGDYEQSFVHQGRRYHHILDPETAEPRRASGHTLTISAACCLDADAAATAFFGLPRPAVAPLLATAAPGASVVHLG